MLSDVNAEIKKAKNHLANLEQSAKIIQGSIDAKEPFPEALLGAAFPETSTQIGDATESRTC
jgi:hypothetical protein